MFMSNKDGVIQPGEFDESLEKWREKSTLKLIIISRLFFSWLQNFNQI